MSTVSEPLDGEAFATFGAACVDHGTAAASFHTDQKAVSAFAFGDGRLIGSFHGVLRETLLRLAGGIAQRVNAPLCLDLLGYLGYQYVTSCRKRRSVDRVLRPATGSDPARPSIWVYSEWHTVGPPDDTDFAVRRHVSGCSQSGPVVRCTPSALIQQARKLSVASVKADGPTRGQARNFSILPCQRQETRRAGVSIAPAMAVVACG